MDAGDALVALAGQIPRSCHSLGLSDWTEIPRETLQLKRLLLRPLCGACRLEKKNGLVVMAVRLAIPNISLQHVRTGWLNP